MPVIHIGVLRVQSCLCFWSNLHPERQQMTGQMLAYLCVLAMWETCVECSAPNHSSVLLSLRSIRDEPVYGDLAVSLNVCLCLSNKMSLNKHSFTLWSYLSKCHVTKTLTFVLYDIFFHETSSNFGVVMEIPVLLLLKKMRKWWKIRCQGKRSLGGWK